MVEQTLGEGEFGKVMKAKAQGIAGNPGMLFLALKGEFNYLKLFYRKNMFLWVNNYAAK